MGFEPFKTRKRRRRRRRRRRRYPLQSLSMSPCIDVYTLAIAMPLKLAFSKRSCKSREVS